MGLTIATVKKSTKAPVKAQAKKGVGNDYSAHLGGKPEKAVSKMGSGSLQITKKSMGNEAVLKDEETTLPLKQLIPSDQLATVSVGGSQTINTAPYESVKITVHLSIPSSIHDLDDSYEFASDWVSKKMEEAISNVKG